MQCLRNLYFWVALSLLATPPAQARAVQRCEDSPPALTLRTGKDPVPALAVLSTPPGPAIPKRCSPLETRSAMFYDITFLMQQAHTLHIQSASPDENKCQSINSLLGRRVLTAPVPAVSKHQLRKCSTQKNVKSKGCHCCSTSSKRTVAVIPADRCL